MVSDFELKYLKETLVNLKIIYEDSMQYNSYFDEIIECLEHIIKDEEGE